MLDAIARGAHVSPGAAATFVARSAGAIGVFVARAVPARAVAGVVTVGILVVVALVDPWSALIAAGVVVAVPIVLVVLGRRAEREASASLAGLRSLATRALELLDGAVELRALGALDRGREELAAATDRAVVSTRASLRTALRSASALDVLAGLAVGLVAMTDGLRLLQGAIPFGHALAAVLLTAEVFAPLRSAGAAFHAGADGRAALAFLDASCASLGPPRAEQDLEATSLAPSVPPAVRASEVALSPAPGAPIVVEVLELDVPAGGRLVVLGPTGSGKSTVLRAISGVPLVARGVLLVGDAEPSALPSPERAATFGFVEQRPFLLAGTLRENLELGGTPRELELLIDVVRRCGLTPLLDRLGAGLDSLVGEDGRLLSAGERTRVALARVVLREPGVVLLDEVGAHLDDASLDALRSGLADFLDARTVIEAAHDRPLLVDASSVQLATAAEVR
jgi:ABC-type transport system involved in cytochrome bd biosynthesis fused ATPase/permease subunit